MEAERIWGTAWGRERRKFLGELAWMGYGVFESRLPTAFWRGANSGFGVRHLLVDEWAAEKNAVDIGFDRIVGVDSQHKAAEWGKFEDTLDVPTGAVVDARANYTLGPVLSPKTGKVFKLAVKEKARLVDFAKHKFIVTVVGNDRESGLVWKAISGSLLFWVGGMKVDTWFMVERGAGVRC